MSKKFAYLYPDYRKAAAISAMPGAILPIAIEE